MESDTLEVVKLVIPFGYNDTRRMKWVVGGSMMGAGWNAKGHDGIDAMPVE